MDISNYFKKDSSSIVETNTMDNDFMHELKKLKKNDEITLSEYTTIIEYTNHALISKMHAINKIIDNYPKLKKYITNAIPKHISSIDDIKVLTKNFLDNTENKYSSDQKMAVNKIFKFLYDPKQVVFGLYGYAGTGKTTLISEVIAYLIKNKLIRCVALTAPTHQAVNVINSQVNKLFDDKNTQDCCTIHKLLQYENEFNQDGSMKFVKGKKSLFNKYELIVIDETSMVGLILLNDILDEKKVKKLFVGDPAQLTPVNEKICPLFIPKNIYIDKTMSYIMDQVVRSSDKDVVGLCTALRRWINNEISNPDIGRFKGKKVHFYNFKSDVKTINTKWMKKYLDSKYIGNSIILTWTNKKSTLYNDIIRAKLFKKKKIDQIEIGDKLIFYNFYKTPKIKSYEDKEDISISFYTSNQVNVLDTEITIKKYKEISYDLPAKKQKIKDFTNLEAKYYKCIKNINENTNREYKIWNTKIEYVQLSSHDEETKQAFIYILHNDSEKKLDIEKKYAQNEIQQLVNNYNKHHSESINSINRYIINPLWKKFNKIFVDPFAPVDYGNARTCHKSQGSTYHNVFVDLMNILLNPTHDEAKRCAYVACSRPSNELHILLPPKK
jgi:hypothetical protein